MKKVSMLFLSFFLLCISFHSYALCVPIQKSVYEDALVIDNCPLSIKDMKTIATFLSANPLIIRAVLTNDQLSDDHIAAFSGALVRNYLLNMEVSNNYLSTPGIVLLASMPLQSLDLSNESGGISVEAAKALAANTHLFGILGENDNIDDQGAAALAQSHNISYLLLDRNNIGEDGSTALANDSLLNSLVLDANHLDDRAAIALSTSEIQQISLTDNPIGVAGYTALAADKNLKQLSVGNKQLKLFNDQDMLALAQGEQIPNLFLIGVSLQDDAATALGQNRALQYLTFSAGSIEKNAQMSALAKSRSLRSLAFSGTQGVGDEALAYFVNHSSLYMLRVDKSTLPVPFDHYPITDRTAFAFASSRNAVLMSLSLDQVSIYAPGFKALAANKSISRLYIKNTEGETLIR